MTQQTFLEQLEAALDLLPPADCQRSLDYYREIIGDRMEEGCSEEEAVAALGDPAQIARQILAETETAAHQSAADAEPISASTSAPNTMDKNHRSLRIWEIVLLILGAPLWFPLLLAAVIVLLSLLLTLWVLVLSLYALPVALFSSGLGCTVGAFLLPLPGLGTIAVLFGTGLMLLGLGILLFYGMGFLVKGTARLTGACWKRIFSKHRKQEAVAQ